MMKKILFVKDKWNTVLTIAVFLLLIGTMTAASLLKPDRVFSPSENRYLKQKPAFSMETFFNGEYSSDYEEYITDQFVGRDRWIGLKTAAELAMGKKDINGVYICRDDYLIEMHDDIDEDKAYSNADRMLSFLNKEAEVLGKEHVTMMIVPTAVTILKDKLPDFAMTFDQNGYIDYMQRKMEGNFVDVRTTLTEHADEEVYYRTDHHWTSYGAYLAYCEWAESLGMEPYSAENFDISLAADDFLGTVYSKINYARKADKIYLYKIKDHITYDIDFNMGMKKSNTLYAMEHLDTKDKYSVFLDGNNSIVTIDTVGGRTDGETLLIIKDSYAHCFIPFAVNHYARTVVIDLRYLKMPVSKVMENYNITDVLVLYNAIHFAEDMNMPLLEY